MAQYDFLTGPCPHCGEMLEIPNHLSVFSCVYCGARLSSADLGSTAPEISAAEAEAAAAYYREHILSVITEHRGIERALSRNAYEPAVNDYQDACGKIFSQLNTACKAEVITPREAADWFLDQLSVQWELDLKKKKPGMTRNNLMDGDKFMIAVFLVPMIRRMGLSCMETYCEALHEAWLERYPKAIWQIGDFDTINTSFRKKLLGFCFITTAVCLETGKGDDCAQLTAFRNFRDVYLQNCSDGPALIEEYYRIGPRIVLEIEKSADPQKLYRSIAKEYLDPCYKDLQNGRPDRCKDRYVTMVRRLAKEYLS